jgi:hypothetical protein
MNYILSVALVTAMAIAAIGLVFMIFSPMITTMTSSSEVNDAQAVLSAIDKNIQEVVRGGSGAAKIFVFSKSPKMLVTPEEDSIKYSKDIDSSIFEYLTRKIVDRLAFIAGSDVNCNEYDANNDGNAELVLENSYVLFAFRKTAPANPMSAIDTKNNIVMIKEKTYSNIIYPANSSVVIDENIYTSYGVGYSQILRAGNGLHVCTVRFYINSTSGIKYDIYYKLYAGADFVVVDIRNPL